MRLIDLFFHWRDPHLYELQALIAHVRDATELSTERVSTDEVVSLSFELDANGRPSALRQATPLRRLLSRYGSDHSAPVAVAPLLGTLRLERERRLRGRLIAARNSLARLLDAEDIRVLRGLPSLAPGPGAAVAGFLQALSARKPLTALRFPATALAQALSGSEAQALLGEVHDALGWDAGQPRHAALALQDLALLTLVLPWALDPGEDFHGFDFYAPALTGVAVSELLAALKSHLMPRLAGCPSETFAVIRYLLQASGPAQLNLLRLPPGLAWVSSLTWVLLTHGVTLAETIAPGATARLSFEEALDLPARVAEHVSGERMSQAVLATLLPALERWRTANQRVPGPPAASLSEPLERFLAQMEALDNAAGALRRPMPQRWRMIHAELEARGMTPDLRFVEAKYRVRQSLRPNAGLSALEAVASGLAAGPTPAWVPALVRGHSGGLFEPWVKAKNIPDVNALFERDFSEWKQGVAMGSNVVIQRLLEDLPLADRLRLEQHPVTLYKLARQAASPGTLKVAAYGFLVYANTPTGAWWYQLIPMAGWCQVQADPHRARHAPRDNTPLPQPLPLDWQAFATGVMPAPQASYQGWLVPVLQIAPGTDPGGRPFENARLIAEQCASELTKTLNALYPVAQGNPQHLTDKGSSGALEAIKLLVPFWSSVETIAEGVEDKSAWLLMLGALGLVGDLLTLGALGRLSALGLRFVALASRGGVRKATQLLGPRLRSASRDALDALIPVGADPQASAPVADLGLILSIRRNHGALLTRAARRGGAFELASRTPAGQGLAPPHSPSVRPARFEDNAWSLVNTQGTGPGFVSHARLVDPYTALPYGPGLDIIDDTGRLGRLPKMLAVTEIAGTRYVPDPAPSLPLTWIRWGDETWLECSGRFYRLREGTGVQAAAFEQAPAPFARPRLKRTCRLRRGLHPLTCLPGGERATAGFQELPPDAVMAPGAVDWFDQRKVIPASDARFVDSRRLVEVRQGREEVTRHLVWADYRSELTARRIAGNDLFQRLEINRGLIEGVEDRRILSAVQVQASETGQLHIVTCVDDGIFYRGVLMPDEDVITLHKLAEGNSPTAQVMTEAEELKFLFNGCWDANLHIRERGMTVVQEHLRQIEADLAIRGPDISPLMSRRFRLTTTPAQAVLFAKYPRRTFATHTRQFATSEYTFPLTDTTPPAVRSSIATHLNTLTGVPGGFNAANVLDPSAIANIPPKGKNIAFLALTYTDGRPPEVFYSASGAARNKTDLALGRRLAKEGIDSTAPWTGAEGTRYINCRGEGAEAAADSLLHLPDLSQPGSLSTRQRNDRRLDAERNILARLERGGIQGDEVAEAYLFTRFPTCQSCTTLIAQYREQFPAGRFSVYEGPLPARVNVEPGAPTQ